MMADRDSGSSARRRRDRKLRMMALADALHHSAQPRARPGENVHNNAPRRQTTPLASGSEYFIGSDDSRLEEMRPPPLEEDGAPCTMVQSLELSALRGGGDAVDCSALVLLLTRDVQDRRTEEKERAEEDTRMDRLEISILEDRKRLVLLLHAVATFSQHAVLLKAVRSKMFLKQEESTLALLSLTLAVGI